MLIAGCNDDCRLFADAVKMSENFDNSEKIDVILPRQGLLYQEEPLDYVLCKPKLIPLKSVTLEKLEKMQRDAELKLREAEKEIKSSQDEQM